MQPPPSLLHIDLCMLAYQLYHQSVIWPLDPWYEVMSRTGASRRENFMKKVHASASAADGLAAADGYSGPGSIRGTRVNATLDPVITNYHRINPRSPAFTRDGEKYMAAQTPGYITQEIKTVEVAAYKRPPGINPLDGTVEHRPICDFPTGREHLIAFEGGTGIANGRSPAWSLMGFLLTRHRPDGGYDLHIAFRGSRSGSAARAVKDAMPSPVSSRSRTGNPDWVTDVQAGDLVSDVWVSQIGGVSSGFASAVRTSMGSIHASLLRLNRIYGAPSAIWVTGHSLGAALCAHLTSAMAQGKLGDILKHHLPEWPWSSLRCIPFAQPGDGNEDWEVACASEVSATHYWVKGDPVVEKGLQLYRSLRNLGSKICLEPPCTGESPHEPHLIRAALIRDLKAQQEKDGTPLQVAWIGETPWAYYHSFADMLEGAAFSHQRSDALPPKIVTAANLRSVLLNYKFGQEFDRFVRLLEEVVTMESSYKAPSVFVRTSGMEEKRTRLEDARGKMGQVTIGEKAALLANLEKEVLAIQGVQDQGTDKYVGLGLIISAIQRTSLTLADIKGRRVLNACLVSKLNKD